MKTHLQRYKRGMQSGDTLLEIALALWLIGVAALGSIRLQLWTERAQRAALWRTHAAHLAESAAEALRSGTAITRVISTGNARAAAHLPEGGLRVFDKGPEIRLIVVHWNETAETAQWPDASNHDTEDCPQSGTRGMTQCLFITVVK